MNQYGYSRKVVGESEVISETLEPATPRTLAEDMSALGLVDGAVVIVRSAMSRLGWIAGGAQSVVEALLAVVGANGPLSGPRSPVSSAIQPNGPTRRFHQVGWRSSEMGFRRTTNTSHRQEESPFSTPAS